MIRRLAAIAAATALVAAAPADPFRTPVAAGYQPADKDERGLWLQMTEFERALKTSAFVVRDPALNDYVRGVFCRLAGEVACRDVRIYIVRTADFNASMAPTGMMMVNTGLLLRMRDEAQLAAILGHEYAHYTHRHSLQSFRDVRGKANAMAFLSMLPVGGLAAVGAISVAQLGMAASIFSFSRGMEAEADAKSIPMMRAAGYDPTRAWHVWEQLRAEQDATAAARGKRSRKDVDGGIFGSHPPTADRLAALRTLAAKEASGGVDGRAAYRTVLARWWPTFVDDQIKRNDFGATEYLLAQLAADDWSPDLLYARGELYRTRGTPADLAQATGFYREAVAQPTAPAEAWRGLGLAELRTGNEPAGHAALRTYLTKKPDAADRPMIAMLAGEAQ